MCHSPAHLGRDQGRDLAANGVSASGMSSTLAAPVLQPPYPSGEGGSNRLLWIGDLAYYIDEAFLTNVFAKPWCAGKLEAANLPRIVVLRLQHKSSAWLGSHVAGEYECCSTRLPDQGTGALLSARIMRNRATQTSEGYGFLEFSSHDAAQQVLNSLNGKAIPGTDQLFRLNWAPTGESTDHSVFVGDLAAEVTDYILQEQFKRYFASVRSAKVISDPLTGRSKGYGFVRFGNEQERDRALGEMMGHPICNRPIRVSVATARKNVGGGPGGGLSQGIPHPSDFDPTNTTLFIGGLTGGVSEEDLRSLFGRYGEIIYTKIPPGKGCGFVQFVQRPAAEAALAQLQGQLVGTAAIRISWGRSSSASRAASTAHASSYSYQAPYAGSALPGYPVYTQPAYGSLPQATNPALDPYAAYAYALSQQAATTPGSQLQSVSMGAGDYGPSNPANSASALRALLAQQHGRPEQSDPLAALDVGKLNAAYLQRNQASFLGALNSLPVSTGPSGALP